MTTEVGGVITGVLSILRLVTAVIKFVDDAGDLVINWVLTFSRLLLQFLIDLTQSLEQLVLAIVDSPLDLYLYAANETNPKHRGQSASA